MEFINDLSKNKALLWFFSALLLQAAARLRKGLSAAFAAAPGSVSLVSCLQLLARGDRGMWLDPTQLASAAGAAGGVAAAVVQLEDQMMYSEGEPGVCAIFVGKAVCLAGR